VGGPNRREEAIPRIPSSKASGRLVDSSRPRCLHLTLGFTAGALALAVCLSFGAIAALSTPAAAQTPDSTPVPHVDRLAIPVLPDSPTLVELGSYSYYYNCMPCHGDQGQGLTDEFRGIWPEDHQYCWGRGCHAGRPGEAFKIPRSIPPVIGLPQPLARFATARDLETYLEETHPPQRPGALSDEEYWALTAYLLAANGREDEIPSAAGTGESVLLVTLGSLGGVLLVAWVAARTAARTRNREDGPEGGKVRQQ
jgi:hypothetical protein